MNSNVEQIPVVYKQKITIAYCVFVTDHYMYVKFIFNYILNSMVSLNGT